VSLILYSEFAFWRLVRVTTGQGGRGPLTRRTLAKSAPWAGCDTRRLPQQSHTTVFSQGLRGARRSGGGGGSVPPPRPHAQTGTRASARHRRTQIAHPPTDKNRARDLAAKMPGHRGGHSAVLCAVWCLRAVAPPKFHAVCCTSASALLVNRSCAWFCARQRHPVQLGLHQVPEHQLPHPHQMQLLSHTAADHEFCWRRTRGRRRRLQAGHPGMAAVIGVAAPNVPSSRLDSHGLIRPFPDIFWRRGGGSKLSLGIRRAPLGV
jgi:hypothetical protein